MSPTHLRFDRAVQDLRDEGPSSEQRHRALGAVLNPRRRRLKTPTLAVAAVAIGVGLALIPARGSSLALAEALRRTQQAMNQHITYFDKKGRVSGELWKSGTMRAVWLKDGTGRITVENRSDHAHYYTYMYRRELSGPNATQYGTLWNVTPQMLRAGNNFGGPAQTIDALLNSGRAKLVSQERAVSQGSMVQRYVLRMYGKELETVDADTNSGRILVVRDADGESQRYDYPEAIDPKTFSFEARLTRDVAVLDLRGKENPRQLAPYMPQPIASKDGISLRAVNLGAEGDLYVFWTGYLPDRHASKRLRVLGTRTGAVRWLGYDQDGVHRVQGPVAKRLICYRVALRDKVGDRISIEIPTPTSTVEFKDVPIKRLEPLR